MSKNVWLSEERISFLFHRSNIPVSGKLHNSKFKKIKKWERERKRIGTKLTIHALISKYLFDTKTSGMVTMWTYD